MSAGVVIERKGNELWIGGFTGEVSELTALLNQLEDEHDGQIVFPCITDKALMGVLKARGYMAFRLVNPAASLVNGGFNDFFRYQPMNDA